MSLPLPNRRQTPIMTGLLLVLLTWHPPLGASEPLANVILVTMDGLRWQELFMGMDSSLLGDADNGTEKSADQLQERFGGDTADERRQKLMPFFWSTIRHQGLVYGNPEHDSHMRVTNSHHFSYPGYSEILCGFADPRIDSNAKTNNPNVTVLEWLHRQQGFAGRVRAFCSWDVFPWIINTQRSGIPVNAGWMPLSASLPPSPGIAALDQVADQLPHYWEGVRFDAFTATGAGLSLQHHQPRVLYVSLGETDDWAHDARYDLYLDAAHRNDAAIRRLWETAQSLTEYRNKTALVLTTDHGRGDDRVSWRSHNTDIPGCDRIWAAVLAPDIATPGPVPGRFTQTQIAATVARLLGRDYAGQVPQAGSALPGLPATGLQP